MQFFCKFISNTASRGGGVYEGILYNCVLIYNVASCKAGDRQVMLRYITAH